jgi:hypothetical protein
MSNSTEAPVHFSGLITVEKRRLLPEGDYTCRITSWRTMFMFGGHKLIIDCDLSDSAAQLSFICNIPITNEGIVKNPGRRSRLYKMLKTLCGNTHGQFNLNDLIGKDCWAHVVTSTRDEKRNEKPVSEHYSIISALLPLITEEENFPF